MLKKCQIPHTFDASFSWAPTPCLTWPLSLLPVRTIEPAIARPRIVDQVDAETLKSIENSIKTVSETAELSPVSTTRVDGPSWRVTGFHYSSTWAVLTARQLG